MQRCVQSGITEDRMTLDLKEKAHPQPHYNLLTSSPAPPPSTTKVPSTPTPTLSVAPVPPSGRLSDDVYHLAAALFQQHRAEKPIHHCLIHYGEKTDAPLPESPDKSSQKQAYQLAFNTLTYQDLLQDIITDCCFITTQHMPQDLLPLVMVMLFDLQDRKFLPRQRSTQEGEGQMPEVREVENSLDRCKTHLSASLARYRIKNGLLHISCVLPDSIRTRQHRAASLPCYAWVNTHTTSLECVCEVLSGVGVCEVECISALKGNVFCRDPLCSDTLVFSQNVSTLLQQQNTLMTQHTLNIQDRSVCLAVSSLRPLLSEQCDVLLLGSFSGLTVTYIAVQAAACSGWVLLCGGDHSPEQRQDIQTTLNHHDMKNVRVLEEGFQELDVWNPSVQRVKAILLLPQCSVTASNDPLDTILTEHGGQETLICSRTCAMVPSPRTDYTH
uniref:Methyltransferase NSUN7 n=1 Tax=Esox lucius TaxID=8010 RepID=A0AAY5KJJ3_ESOLU